MVELLKVFQNIMRSGNVARDRSNCLAIQFYKGNGLEELLASEGVGSGS